MQVTDVNNDGNLDIMMVGNDFSTEVFNGRLDASNGLVLQGNGAGGFKPVMPDQSGFLVRGNAKAMVSLRTADKGLLYIASENRGHLKAWKLASAYQHVSVVSPNLTSCNVSTKTGRKRRVEFYYGNGFLSQSGRYLAE